MLHIYSICSRAMNKRNYITKKKHALNLLLKMNRKLIFSIQNLYFIIPVLWDLFKLSSSVNRGAQDYKIRAVRQFR